MHRFFIPEDYLTKSTVVITGKLVHQLCNVLRLGTGDLITVLDNSGWEYRVELKAVESSRVEGKIVNRTLAAGEPRTRITLYQALLKASNFEVVLQKCTEVGVTVFVPTACERCVAGKPDSKRLSRWQDIIREAAEQSRRGKLPILHNMTPFREACRSARGVSLLPWEGERTGGIGDKLRSYQKTENAPAVNIFIGPEGGFSSSEVEFARSCGIVPVSLGQRILRADTAGLVAAAVTLYEFGEMDSVKRSVV
jgi:16S rRNA (uracil1498-N3)-methyltransferase